MAPHGESIASSYSRTSAAAAAAAAGPGFSKPRRLSSESLKRTVSDISFELSKEAAEVSGLPPISEVEEAKCECCGMAEECTPEYIERVRDKFMGKMVCGLCAEAVKEELQRKGGGAASKAEAIAAHTAACMRFNKYGRAYPVLFSAEAMREMLKKSKVDGNSTRVRAKSISPRDFNKKTAGIARSSSCIPAITREISDLSLASTTNK